MNAREVAGCVVSRLIERTRPLKLNDTLCVDIWTGDKLQPEVRKHLLAVAERFLQFVGVPLQVNDIILTGSMANYSYAPSSDLDVHVVYDPAQFADDEVAREMFNAKRALWNSQHDVKVSSHDVEVYPHALGEPHAATGIYSILHDRWLIVPVKGSVVVDADAARQKAETLKAQVEAAESYEELDAIAQKIKRMRVTGLLATGEFSPENLAFKILRNDGTMEKLIDKRNKCMDKELSLESLEDVGMSPEVFIGYMKAAMTAIRTPANFKRLFTLEDIFYDAGTESFIFFFGGGMQGPSLEGDIRRAANLFGVEVDVKPKNQSYSVTPRCGYRRESVMAVDGEMTDESFVKYLNAGLPGSRVRRGRGQGTFIYRGSSGGGAIRYAIIKAAKLVGVPVVVDSFSDAMSPQSPLHLEYIIRVVPHREFPINVNRLFHTYLKKTVAGYEWIEDEELIKRDKWESLAERDDLGKEKWATPSMRAYARRTFADGPPRGKRNKDNYQPWVKVIGQLVNQGKVKGFGNKETGRSTDGSPATGLARRV
jgi:hypothetical protein